MGAGKTEAGLLLAKKLGYNFIDVDECIESAEGLTINDIFKSKGEDYFRQLEKKFIEDFHQFTINSTNTNINTNTKKDLLSLKDSNEYFLKLVNPFSVVSAGGGMPCYNNNIEKIKELGIVIYLKADPHTIFERIKNATNRPALRKSSMPTINAGISNFTEKDIENMLNSRETFYNKADLIIYTDDISIDGVAEEISIFILNK